ncbi:hypothetical protein BDW59DRAFT_99410 [Aspergillus cavernicola]|uniref:Uncharacterized protein n=1 Tax=Aspergillus cavernicola TaxID=176166 RepID=A0ABR4I6Q3_9EURO
MTFYFYFLYPLLNPQYEAKYRRASRVPHITYPVVQAFYFSIYYCLFGSRLAYLKIAREGTKKSTFVSILSLLFWILWMTLEMRCNKEIIIEN